MKRFNMNQRVRVRREANRGLSLDAVGNVVRLRRQDDGAWIALDQRYADELVHPFPADDGHRATHVVAYPEDCEDTP